MIVFFAAGRVPAKNKNMMLRNIKMIKNFQKLLLIKKLIIFTILVLMLFIQTP